MSSLGGRLFVLTLVILFASFACDQSSAPQEENKPPEEKLPALENGIPFDKLGFGKLVFFRYGPEANNYSAVYVIDIRSRSSWGISLAEGAGKAPMVSPDGGKIAFSKNVGDNWDIHVMDIKGGGLQDISNITGYALQPTWTPDSKGVVFFVNSTLYVQSPVPNATDRRVITTLGEARGPFFVSKNWELVFLNGPWQDEKISTMNFQGANLTAISAEAPPEHGFYSPCWAPDGQRIAYLLRSSSGDSLEVMVMDSNGENAKSLVKLKTDPTTDQWYSQDSDNPYSLCWSPDGSKIVFNKVEGRFCYHLYAINADGTGLFQVTFAEGVTDRSVSWSN